MSKKRNNASTQAADEAVKDTADVIEQGIAEATEETPVEEVKEEVKKDDAPVAEEVKSEAAEQKVDIEEVAEAVKEDVKKASKQAKEVIDKVGETIKEAVEDAYIAANVVKNNAVESISASVPDHVNTPNDNASSKGSAVSKKNLKAGGICTLVNEPLYASPYGSRVMRRLTGRFYTYDGVNKNGYYRLTSKKAYVKRDLKYVIGWIKK